MALKEYQNIEIYEKKTVGPYVVAKVCFAVILDRGFLAHSFPRTVIFKPKDPNREIEISDFLDYENIPEEERDEMARFGAHRFANLEDWYDTGDVYDNCPNYGQLKTLEDIERYLTEHHRDWWII